MKTSTCCTCGHTWQTGTDGDHSYSQILTTKVHHLRNEVDQLRYQLTKCKMTALKNTVSSRSRRAIRGDYGHSASYEDVCNAVDREIALREENERLRGWIREEGDRNNTCIRPILHETCDNCGFNQAAIDAARSAKK